MIFIEEFPMPRKLVAYWAFCASVWCAALALYFYSPLHVDFLVLIFLTALYLTAAGLVHKYYRYDSDDPKRIYEVTRARWFVHSIFPALIVGIIATWFASRV